jgi:hypothetical protein
MTLALCLTCGARKHGAMNPCTHCGAEATGDHNLDRAFSDHYMGSATIVDFGRVIQQINGASDDQSVRSWTFMHYISTHYPDILSVPLPGDLADAVVALFDQLNLPIVTVLPGIREQMQPDQAVSARPWWHLWR